MIAIMSDPFLEALKRLPARRLTLGQGERLFTTADPVRSLHLLEAGQLDLVRHRRDGGVVALHRAGPGAIVAEASLYSDTYHCDCVCAEPALVLALPRGEVRRLFRSDPQLFEVWAARLARELQAARQRCEILTRKTVAERFAGWLEVNGALPAKGRWKDVAAEIGVTPEALYREIARRGRRSGP